MALTLTIKPAGKVIGSISPDELDLTPVVLGLDVQEIDGEVKLLADVVFQRIPVIGPLGMGPWYIAAADAQITLRAIGAKIASHSKSRFVDFKRTINSTKKGKLGAEFEPKIEVSETLTVSVLSIGAKRSQSEEETIEISERESELAAVPRGDSVLWVRSSTRGQKAIREYILETLHLWMRCKWDDKNRRGSAQLLTFPNFFNADGKKWTMIRSLVAAGVLKLEPPLMNGEGTSVEFTCDEK